MAIKFNVTTRIGSQDPVDFQLFSSEAAIDLTGINYVDLIRRNDFASTTETFRSNTTVTTTIGSMTITTASTGSIRFVPQTTTAYGASETQYKFYFIINDGSGKDLPVPEDLEMNWKVRFKYS